MNKLSFDIRNSRDFLNKLKEDHSEFIKDPSSSRVAINCAMTAWHLSDWIYHEFDFSGEFKRVEEFQEKLKGLCVSLQVMHDITNGSKHYKLLRHKPKIQETEKHLGTWDLTFDPTFPTTKLEMDMNDGRTLFFANEIQIVITFWEEYLNGVDKA